ncbi:MAG TPA: DUF3152 domain-containing protein [Actinotalea sp.]|nr:DUF3152 domain-containing protein [Actinotalea sp.]
MVGPRTHARTPSAPRHGRRPTRAAALRTPRFGAAVLAVTGGLALVVGAGTGVALGGGAMPVEPAAAAAAPVRAVDRLASDTARGVAPTATPTPAVAPTPTVNPEPEPAPDAVDAAGLTAADRAAGLLSLAVPQGASGELVVVPGSEPAPTAAATVRTVRVEVEAGLAVDPVAFAATVMATLNDPRGWGADGSVSFARTDGDAQIRVLLASPDTVDALCAPLQTVGLYSCGRYGHAALNHTRWVSGTDEFTDLTQYRQYLVNHEVGHLLGQPHEQCPSDGSLAPIMQQQTVRVAPCLPNAWPHPDAG